MLNKSRELFEAWNNNTVSYCHWKGNNHLMEGLDGKTDMDVLLALSDKEKGCSFLKEIGFVQFKSQYGSRNPNIEDWIGLDEESGRLLHLHLHYALITGHTGLMEYELPWKEEALKTRVVDPECGVFIMNPNLELVSLYNRLILKAKRTWFKAACRGKFKMDDHFQNEISYIKARVDWRSVEEIVNRYYGVMGHDFYEIVKYENLDSALFLRLFDIVDKTYKSSSRYHGVSLRLRRFLFPLIIALRNRLKTKTNNTLITKKVKFPQCGYSIAFIGQDGSGKSSLTKDIKKWLTWKIEADCFYLGSGDGYHSIFRSLLEKSATILHKSKKSNSKNNCGGSKNDKKSLITSAIVCWNMLIIARHSYRVLIRAEKYRKKGGIALYDRFPQMQYEGIYDGPKIPDYCRKHDCEYWVNKMMAKREKDFFLKIQRYQPTLVFKLLLPPEESIRRKPSENFEMIKEKHKITSELEYPYSLVCEIDATQAYQQELINVKNIIWNTCFISR